MYIIDPLKLNKYIPVSIPRNRDLYARVGGRVPSLGTTGFTAEFGKSKLDVISDDIKSLTEELDGIEGAM